MVRAHPAEGRRDWLVAGILLVLAVATSVLGPEPAVLGGQRLAANLLMGAGAWLLIGRVGAVDLAVAASAGAGALVAGITASEMGLPGLALLPAALLSGGVLGAFAGAATGRVGRTAGALATLALATGFVAVARSVDVTGGRSGFHAVPLLAGTDRASLAVGAIVAVAGLLAAVAMSRSTLVARAAVGVAAPSVARSFARRPEFDVGAVGAVAGALLGAGGLLLATSSGSVQADGFGIDALALLGLVAVVAQQLLRRLRFLGPAAAVVVAVGLVHAPGIVLPLAPWIGTSSPLASTGIVLMLAIAMLGARRDSSIPLPDRPASGPVVHPGPFTTAVLEAKALAVPGGTVDLTARPGEVVAVIGANGAGKSTVLARIGGQLPDGGGVRIGDGPLPRTVRGRAIAGLARGWQRPVDAAPGDVLATAGGDPEASAWAASVLHEAGDSRVQAVLTAVAARRPAVLLLDEPAAVLHAAAVAAYVRGMADAGAAVVLVEHRPEVLAVADRQVRIGP